MRTSIIVFLMICLSSINAASSSRTDSSPSQEASTISYTAKSTTELITLLDSEVQRRFRDTNNGFGLSRLETSAHHFQPENASEFAAVAELEQLRADLLIYLGGVSLYDSMPEHKECEGRNSGHSNCLRKFIRGPIQVTKADISDAPEGQALWNEAAKAMALFDKEFEYAFTYKDWNFIARPIRATEEECLLCHSGRGASAKSSKEKKPLQLEDPLGVVVYGYRSRVKN